MSFLEILRTAVANTFRSRLRTTLTILAIFVGAFTLTLTNGVGTGINNYINTQVSSMGASDIMLISKAGEGSTFGGSDSGPAVYDPERVITLNGEGMQVEVMTDGDLETLLATEIVRFQTTSAHWLPKEGMS